MWRVLLYLALFAVAAYGAVWLADHPETVAVTWAGREYSTSLAVGVVAIVVLAMLLSLLWAVVRFLARLPGSIGHSSRQRKRARGLRALSRGIVAVGAGDVTAARRFASEAERLVGDEPLALLLKAQAAQLAGDRSGAESAFRRMTEIPDSRVLGLRGLFIEARRRGDAEAAREHASEAARIAPAVGWANEAVLEDYSASGDWAAAIATVERRTSLGLIDRATSRRQRAVLRTAEAMALEERGLADSALAAGLDAVRLAPDLVPAAALAGQLLSRKGDLKKAAKVIETAWRAKPHPDLAAAYLDLRPGDSALDRLKRAETLARLSSWSPESRLAIARAAIEARQPDRARSTLAPLLEGRPTVPICLMMAEIEGADGNAGGVREWLARAARAPRDAAWIADGVVSERWQPVSPVTGRLDAFQWETPPEVLGAPGAEIPSFAESSPTTIASLAPPAPAAETETEPHSAFPPSGGADVSTDTVPASEAGSGPEPIAELPPVAPAEPPMVAEPIGTEPLRSTGGPALASAFRPGQRSPEPVVFPVRHAPDDPGPDALVDARQPRFRLRG